MRILFITLLLISLTTAQFASGPLNLLRQDFDFVCPQNSAITHLQSTFSDGDRIWEVSCDTIGGLANFSSCLLQDPINTLEGIILDFRCPNNSFIGGLNSEFDDLTSDRVWRPHCCSRNNSALINCTTNTQWDSDITESLEFTAEASYVIIGLESFFQDIVNDRQWRFTQCYLQVDCGDPGSVANATRYGTDFYFGSSVTYTCVDGYYQSSGAESDIRTCQESAEWSGVPPVCSQCEHIDDCADIRCSNSTNSLCHECNSYNGASPGHSAYLNLGESCPPLCSWRHNHCYPGLCPNVTSSCSCAANYSGVSCLQIDSPPSFVTCGVTLHSNTSVSMACTSSTVTPINFIPDLITGDWQSIFSPPSPQFPFPDYVTAFRVGVSSAQLVVSLARASNPSSAVSQLVYDCNVTSLSPGEGLTRCEVNSTSGDLTNQNVFHGDILRVELTAVSGGYLQLFNFDTNTSETVFYNGTETIRSVAMQVDLLPPSHCSIDSVCPSGHNYLATNETVTRTGVIKVSWGGWFDLVSGVLSYSVEVFEMIQQDGELVEVAVGVALPLINHQSNVSVYDRTIQLTNQGPHSVILKVLDGAGNVQLARALVLYDSSSVMAVDTSLPLSVVSGEAISGVTFQSNLAPNPIIVSGQGHFYNTLLRNNAWLSPVRDYPGVETQFDHPFSTGVLPRQGTLNALGVVSLFYAVVSDSQGGTHSDSLSTPQFVSSATNFTLESVAIDVSRSDGETLTIWLMAVDYLGQSTVAFVQVHIDASPPNLDQLFLSRLGVGGLQLLGSESFLDLSFELTASDLHSSLHDLYWEVSMDSSVIGSGYFNVTSFNVSRCVTACVCDPLGVCVAEYHIQTLPAFNGSDTIHDTDYILLVRVRNRANLSSTTLLHFTTDHTPPTDGFVADAPLSHPDIDFHTSNTLTGSWDGFYDPESDILLYQFSFSTQCLDQAFFSYPNAQISSTTERQVSSATNTSATYYLTVVAYNQALVPSRPVCSDGITVDTSPPILRELKIESLYTRPGLVRATDGGVWYVNSRFQRILVDSPSSGCLTAQTNQLFDVIPVRGSGLPSDPCSSPLYTQEFFFRSSHLLYATWQGQDDYGIRDFYAAVSNSSTFPTQTTSTSGRKIATLFSTDLIQGNEVYFHISALDQAELSVSYSIGPILVDTSPPVAQGDLIIVSSSSQLDITWPTNLFLDTEDINPFYYYVSIGSADGFTDILTPTQFTPNRCSSVDFCHSLSISLLEGHVYHVLMEAENSVGLATGISAVHVPATRPPTAGYVFETSGEVSTHATQSLSFHLSDIDTLVTLDSITVRWRGFSHAELNLTFEVALGDTPGEWNIIPFTPVGSVTWHTLTGLSLTQGQWYYSFVRASHSEESTTVQSDGFLVLTTPLAYNVFNTYDYRDSAYQVSNSVVTSSWEAPLDVTTFSHFEWALLRDGSRVVEWQNVANRTQYVYGGVNLTPGVLYQSAVRKCHSSGCDTFVTSDYFTPLLPPTPTNLSATYDTSSQQLAISWSQFFTPSISHYEWSFGTGTNLNKLLSSWQIVSANLTSVSYTFSSPLPNSETLYVFLLGYDTLGQTSHLQTEVLVSGTLYSAQLEEPIIFDSTFSDATPDEDRYPRGPYYDLHPTDLDYSAESNSFGASWPSLRFSTYSVSLSPLPYFACDHVSAVYCGVTEDNYIALANISLRADTTYYTCVRVHTDDSVLRPGHLTNTSEELIYCSDGVTIDLSPPATSCSILMPADVALRPSGATCGSTAVIITTDSNLYLEWEHFGDLKNVRHYLGLSHYEVALGLSPGEDDTFPFTNVGVRSGFYFTGLSLVTRGNYYATVRAVDLVGQSADLVSNPVTIDHTAPVIYFLSAQPDTLLSVTSKSGTEVAWFVSDDDSSLTTAWLSAGSRPGYADLMSATSVHPATTKLTTSLPSASDGEVVFFSLSVANRAGLVAQIVSCGYPIDSSPPIAGLVTDGSGEFDIDFTTNLKTVSATWRPWTEPHGHISHYTVSVGTCVACDDIVTWHSVGLATWLSRDTSLRDGYKYYVTVRGWNLAGLYTQSASNGFIVDRSCPVGGFVTDSDFSFDLQYTLQDTFLSASWKWFFDSHSGISHYSIAFGTTPRASDVISAHRVSPQFSSVTLPLSQPLAELTRVHATLRAYNLVGNWTEVSSDGVTVDKTHPYVTVGGEPAINTSWAGEIIPETQITADLSQVRWHVLTPDGNTDTLGYLILTSTPGTRSIPVQRTAPSWIDTSSHSQLALSDGQTVRASVLSCSVSHICLLSVSDGVLVDSSPPSLGTFVTSSATNAQLSWLSTPTVLTWSSTSVSLVWTGFSDPHSGVLSYSLTVGTQFSGSDLSGGVMRVTSGSDTFVAHSINLTRHISTNETVYVSIWAENGVGLVSDILQRSFVTREDGSLELVRSGRCVSQTCLGHCTCGGKWQLCQQDTSLCVNSTDTRQPVEVLVALNQLIAPATIPIVASRDYVSASWTADPQAWFYEYRVGPVGEVLSGATWRYAGAATSGIVSLREWQHLTPNLLYQFHVRTWYSYTEYSLSSSQIFIHIRSPPTPDTRYPVREVLPPSERDTDTFQPRGNVSVSIKDTFPTSVYNSDLSVSLWISPVNGVGTEIALNLPLQDQYTLSDTFVRPDIKHYTTLLATSPTGLSSLLTSDGFSTDDVTPLPGIVYDGKFPYDVDIQKVSVNGTYTCWFWGFSDATSYISHFLFTLFDTSTGVVVSTRDVGLVASVSVEVDLIAGHTYYSQIVAVDGSGRESSPALSDGVTITTSPQPTHRQLHSSNLVKNPSFDTSIATYCATSSRGNLSYWETTSYATSLNFDPDTAAFFPPAGCSVAYVTDSISQILNLEHSNEYQLSFYLSRPYFDCFRLSTLSVRVSLFGVNKIVTFPEVLVPRSATPKWHYVTLSFTATSATATLSITSLTPLQGFLIDSISLQKLLTTNTSSSAVRIDPLPSTTPTSIHMAWDFTFTPPGAAHETFWALGFIPGGQQLFTLQSVGTARDVWTPFFLIQHNTTLHATIFTRDLSGSYTVLHSDPIIVDKTPPGHPTPSVSDGSPDWDAVATLSVPISISGLSETQSSLKRCLWAIGSSPWGHDIRAYTQVADPATFPATYTPPNLNSSLEGSKLYSTVICVNTAGLVSKATTDGVILGTQPPDQSNAVLTFYMTSLYPIRNNFISSQEFSVWWEGFDDVTGALRFDFRILGGGLSADWIDAGYKVQVNVYHDSLIDGTTYEFQVRATNKAQLSSVISSNFTYVTELPVQTLDYVNASIRADGSLQIDWSSMFSVTRGGLRFEVFVSDLSGYWVAVPWVSTFDTSITVPSGKFDPTRSHFVSVTAVTDSGLDIFHQETVPPL